MISFLSPLSLTIQSAGGLGSAESELGGAEVIKINPNPTQPDPT